MAIKRFSEYLEEQHSIEAVALVEQSVSKTLEFSNDGVEIFINITLSKQNQHADAVQFLRQVADELSALGNATQLKEDA